jgi:hypothetical protein
LETYRGVQPLRLEPYFRALRSRSPTQEVPKLLKSDEPMVIERVLGYLNGCDMLPSPDGLEFWSPKGADMKRRRQPMTQFTEEIEKLLDRKQPEIRLNAAAVYAEFAGKKSVPRIRQLLLDRDVRVRGTAIQILARYDDRGAGEAICRAMHGNRDQRMASEIVQSLAKWRNLQTVPALIEFLQNDDSEAVLAAQAALKKVTGFDFPPEVEPSQKAWDKAKTISDARKRAGYLSQVLPYDPQPLDGSIVQEGKDTVLILRNRSKKAVLLAKVPTAIAYVSATPDSYQDSYRAYQIETTKSKNAYVTLAPGATLRVKTQAGWPARSSLKHVTVYFLDRGRHLGLKAWIGTVVLVLDPKWNGSLERDAQGF